MDLLRILLCILLVKPLNTVILTDMVGMDRTENGLTPNVKSQQNKGAKWTTTLDFRLWFKLLHHGRIVRVLIYV